ncbi:hypothetical protein [Xenorhabdus griffiniae]|uniref:Lipoprotein n=1 Tax=Xenorhabdus griffiniae TaxID=351672 RepID=A0ABY9XME1_9GAMM|nr:hypothetical protein [Xenorhabdus griffiniae]MBD1227264.1 hypothetical protein [Xenorhabdus griffiniae]MBE8586693.1 hypothetical protein [Xenorhabdus griffiniae]WMV73989.1 hypothetical protein QL128_08340 [Xenorhabdus griffiniae]WNH03669.1 hypothetical protein QL112_008345 [Xenorhabdus griffiniae]
MKKLLMALMLILTGCDTDYSKYDGVYTCKIGRLMNYVATDRGSEYVFPLGIVNTRMTFSNGVMIIHGMKSGDYVGHEMTMTVPSVTPDGRKLMSEPMFKYDDGEFNETFFPKYAIATLSVGSPRDGIMQQLTNCKKEQ